jgi:type IV pilus assembly protein PilO
MKWSDVQNLDFENVGSWPIPIKIVSVILLCAAILGAGWYFHNKNQLDTLRQAEAQEQNLRSAFEAKQKKVANLEALKQQLADIQASFGDMLRRLPNKTEVAALLVDISQQGLGAGLEFELFKPGKEQPENFYVELPIQIRVTGKYHEFGRFVSGVADLPRIVTQHDIKITAREGSSILTMEEVAKTYRYIDENEQLETVEATKK